MTKKRGSAAARPRRRPRFLVLVAVLAAAGAWLAWRHETQGVKLEARARTVKLAIPPGASADAIQPLLDAFGQDALRLVLKPTAGGEEARTPLLRHVLKLYLVDAAGDVRNIYSSGLMSPELLMADLRSLQIRSRIARGDRVD